MNILNFLPEPLKKQMLDGVVEFIANQAERVPGGTQAAKGVRQLSSQAAFYTAFDKAMDRAVQRFIKEYTEQDEDLVEAVISDTNFWESESVRKALMEVIKRPGTPLDIERDSIAQHFADILPRRIQRDRVDKAVFFLLRCLADELWTLPGAKEIREVYNLQFNKISAEASRQQVALLEAQLQATTQLSADVRTALLQLTSTFEQHLLSAPTAPTFLPRPRPYHNLPQPDYTQFVGRVEERKWLRARLAPTDRAWQIAITGIGGVGKSALAQAIGHEYREEYQNKPQEERFDVIVWVSAKEETLTVQGKEQARLSGLTFRTLEDIYTTIAQAMDREDITRALPEEQDRLVQKVLSEQRTLIIVDNMETVSDPRVKMFLRNLPTPTKAIITSREWLDVAEVLPLTGLHPAEADQLIAEEIAGRAVKLSVSQREELIKRTAGLPLPIKLSVARLRSGQIFDQVIRWLGNAMGDLPSYCVNGQGELIREHDVNALKLLLACTLFDRDAGASREALGTITDLSIADRDDGLTHLLRLSLINETDSGRFWLLPIVQVYATEQLARASFGDQLLKRWLEWAVELAQVSGKALELRIENIISFSRDYPNLRTAVRWCREHQQWRDLLKVAEGTTFYAYVTGLFSEFREIIESAVYAAEALDDDKSKGQFELQFGRLAWVQGQYDKALLEHLNNAERIANDQQDNHVLAQIYRIRSDISWDRNNRELCKVLLKRLLELGNRMKDEQTLAEVCDRVGRVLVAEGKFEEAYKWFARGEQYARQIGSKRLLAWNWSHQGFALTQEGNLITIRKAEQFLVGSLEMAATWGEHRLVAQNKKRLAELHIKTGQLQLARSEAKEALEIFERLGMSIQQEKTVELLKQLPTSSVV